MEKKGLTGLEKFSYGIGAVGKDMVYMLSASYILYYYQDIMGVSAVAMGVILLIARIFDAFNDPVMGILVAKTKTKWGKFRPWLFIGTVTNAIILYLMFAAPPTMSGSGLVAYAAVTYILWGVTYTMMDIPYWSMIPAFTKSGSEREGMAALGRSCAGVGSAVVSIFTVMLVATLGKAFGDGTNNEMIGFKLVAAVVAVLFVVFILITCINIKEKSTVDVESTSVKEMFRALVQNDQAMAVVIAIVMINTALYVTQNLVIYFFKYDFSGPDLWEAHYTMFNTFGGAFQILAMMVLFAILRKFMNTMRICELSFGLAFVGYTLLLIIALAGWDSIYLLLVPAFLIMSCVGLLNVLVTIFLANTVDYGELKNDRRDESVIFSMQTFVVKFASGLSAFIASIVLQVSNISKDETTVVDIASSASRNTLRFSMTIIPMICLAIGVFIFKKKYILTDDKLEEITEQLNARKANQA